MFSRNSNLGSSIVAVIYLRMLLLRALQAEGQSNSTTFSSNFTQAPLPASPDTRNLVRDTVVVILLGLAVVPAVMLITYVAAVLVDRYCLSARIVSYPHSNEEAGELDYGPIAQKAGLRGVVTQQEKGLILEHILAKTIRQYSPPEAPENDIEQNLSQVTVNTSIEAEMRPTQSNDNQGTDSGADAEVASLPLDIIAQNGREGRYELPVVFKEANEDGHNAQDVAQTPPVTTDLTDIECSEYNDKQCCCICLAPYEPGIKIVTGTTGCGHNFHYDCCKQWLVKHDKCPYCRIDMITPAEYHQAAAVVLGEARVAALTRTRQEGRHERDS